MVRARRPHLLPVDDELVTDQLRARRQAREVASGARFAHTEAPRDLRAQRRPEEPVLLIGRAVVVDRGRDDPEALRVRAAQDLAAAHLLEIDHLLRRRRVAAAELRRPTGHEPARVEEGALPVAGPLRHVRARQLGFADPLVRWLVLIEPAVELGAERLVLGCVAQAHRKGSFLTSVSGNLREPRGLRILAGTRNAACIRARVPRGQDPARVGASRLRTSRRRPRGVGRPV